jgi:glycogen phosphorylase
MYKIKLFNVAPSMPAKLAFLELLSRNLWWCWNFGAIELFRRINPQLWKEAGSNPLEFLNRVPQKRFEDLASDEGFLSHLSEVKERFETELLCTTDGQLVCLQPQCIAYFSLEYGIHESIRLYSGGLGVLAGDHLKAASDLNIPLVAVGLMYRQGFFQQYLNNDGWQQESYPENEIHLLPLKKAFDTAGHPVQVTLPLPEGQLKAVVWQLDVGRIPLYLLDANIPENPPELRKITSELYVGDRLMRLRQELLLGIGGYRALLEMGYDPYVCHMNEGHAAFVSVARISHLMKSKGLDLDTVMEIVPRTNVFTTHTPVPAGNEAFAVDLLKPHLEALRKDTEIDPATIISWGQSSQNNHQDELSMTILGLRMSKYSNGVSRLHGTVERKIWNHLWPGLHEDEIPIGHITNGIHVPSWLSREMAILFERYLGPEWRDNPSDPAILSRIADIPDEELWRAHELGRSRLIRTTRELAEKQLAMRNATRTEILQAKSIFGYDVLTIGFARRFATYKRAVLLLQDLNRLEALLCNETRPVQIIFAGKAHPADNAGKDLIRHIVHLAQKPSLKGHIVFLENYDIHMARYLVQGADVWLNTPRRPLEASGTSGMKAGVNGGLNVSILDGWWDEGYSTESGWAIGHGEEYDDPVYQDTVESQALYNVLENDVIPCFYDRPSRDVPDRWARMMKASIKMALGYFTSNRMVREYNAGSYKPALEAYQQLVSAKAEYARKLVAQRARLQALWGRIKIELPVAEKELGVMHVGDKFTVTSSVHLGDLRPDEVDVEVYFGPVNAQNEITESHIEQMTLAEDHGKGDCAYKQLITCSSTGRYGFTTRVTPHGNEWKGVMPGFITWANGS